MTPIRCCQHTYNINHMFSTHLWHKSQTYNTLTPITRPYTSDTNHGFIKYFWHQVQAYSTSNTNLRSLNIRHQSQVFNTLPTPSAGSQHISDTNHMLTTYLRHQSHAFIMIGIVGTQHASDTNHRHTTFQHQSQVLTLLTQIAGLQHFPTWMCLLITHFWHKSQAYNTLLAPITRSYHTSDTNHHTLYLKPITAHNTDCAP